MKQARKIRGQKKPLYRKENTRTHGVRHGNGGEYRWNRRKKGVETNPHVNSSMKSHHRHGLDYTPLFKFLLSKVGQDWDSVHSEAVSRIDTDEPIYWMVARNESEKNAFVRIGEDSYYSGLFVDLDNILRMVAPSLTAEMLVPYWYTGTYTLNGIKFGREYEHDAFQINNDTVEALMGNST